MRISDWSSDVCSSDLALFEFPQYLPFALLAMAEHPAHQLPRLGHGGAVRGVIDAVAPVIEFRQARHIGCHVAVGRADDAGRPGHHMIAREQRAAFDQTEAEVVRGMAGGDRKSTSLNSSH